MNGLTDCLLPSLITRLIAYYTVHTMRRRRQTGTRPTGPTGARQQRGKRLPKSCRGRLCRRRRSRSRSRIPQCVGVDSRGGREGGAPE